MGSRSPHLPPPEGQLTRSSPRRPPTVRVSGPQHFARCAPAARPGAGASRPCAPTPRARQQQRRRQPQPATAAGASKRKQPGRAWPHTGTCRLLARRARAAAARRRFGGGCRGAPAAAARRRSATAAPGGRWPPGPPGKPATACYREGAVVSHGYLQAAAVPTSHTTGHLPRPFFHGPQTSTFAALR